jgi:transposase-like protein
MTESIRKRAMEQFLTGNYSLNEITEMFGVSSNLLLEWLGEDRLGAPADRCLRLQQRVAHAERDLRSLQIKVGQLRSVLLR